MAIEPSRSKSDGKLHLRSRNNKDFAKRYPKLFKGLEELPDENSNRWRGRCLRRIRQTVVQCLTELRHRQSGTRLLHLRCHGLGRKGRHVRAAGSEKGDAGSPRRVEFLGKRVGYGQPATKSPCVSRSSPPPTADVYGPRVIGAA